MLSYLLDGLHEDLNRVINKPTVDQKESDGRPDSVVSLESWENHLKRNRSIIQELLHGQFKSTLDCPDCKRVSITFDPYMMISLPIPSQEYSKFFLYFIFDKHRKLPSKIYLNLPNNATKDEVLEKIANVTKASK